MADSTDDDALFEQAMAAAREAAKKTASTQTPTPAISATPAAPADPESVQFEQNMAPARVQQAQNTPPPTTPPATGGIARNIAAGATDAAGNVANTVVDPSGNLIGKPLATAIVFAHDALAPYLGYPRFPDDVRNLLLGDTLQQPGSRAVDTTANALGFDPGKVTADTAAERITRKAVGAAGSVAALGPGGSVAAPAVGAAGAVAGDQAATLAPDWAKPATELAGNVLAAGAAKPVADLVGKGSGAITGTGGGVSPPVAELAQVARDKYGIPVPAPLMSDNSLIRSTYDQASKLPFSGAGPNKAALDEAWHAAVDKEIGGSGSATFADSKVMAANAKRIGGGLDAIAARTNIDTNADPQLLNDLADIETRAHSGQIPLARGGTASIDANIKGVQDSAAAGGGVIPGDIYQKMTQTGSALDRASSAGDVHTQGFNQEIMDALDRAHQRAASPADQAELSKLRYQYRVMKTVQPLAEKSTDGTIPPASLMTSVNSQSRRFDPSTGGVAYTGGGNLGELGKIGKQFLGSTPNSTTADRMLVNSLLGGGTLLGGGGAVATGLINPLSLLAVPGGLAANRLGGAYLRSDGLANRLIDSSLNPPGPRAALLPSAALTGSLGYNALAASPSRR